MSIIRTAGAFALSLAIFVVIDLFWIGYLMKDRYADALADKARMVNGELAPLWPAALATWFLIVLGIFIFVLPYADSLAQAAYLGAWYGFILYGVYDLTNYATLAGWPLQIVLLDMAWGTILNVVISAVAFFLVTKMH